ncbi:MAG: TolC family protein [Pirellulales bacterium]|nr:TolC family protein [Pirellulales bacterium]
MKSSSGNPACTIKEDRMSQFRSKLLPRLMAFAALVLPAGCLSTGSKVADTRDPFLEPTIHSRVTQASSETDETEPDGEVLLASLSVASEPSLPIPETSEPLPVETEIGSGVYLIDLANALGLGGADNLQVRLARTRLFQAQARHLQAKTLWLPSLRFGVGYNKHDGRLQETVGNVIEVERNSLFYGGGIGLGNTPLTAGAGGPPRLFVNLSLADAYFKPLAACQEVAAHGAAERVATNDSLAEIAVGYHSLVEAHGMLANATAARELAQNMVDTVESFEREGFSSKTEVNRARTELAKWQRAVAEAERITVVRSAELARVLRLPPQVQLAPVEEFVMPIDLVDPETEADALISMAWRSRPEISQYVALREAACFRVREEKWRPWIPNVHAGASGGGFGGGVSTQFPSAAGRSDVDLLAIWEWQNLGLGNVALQRQRRGELHERVLELEALREKIAAEVVAATADVASYRRQMELARESIAAAQESYNLNLQRIRAGEGLPIELLQSISALAEAQTAYTFAVANYNRAQYRLMRAMGNPAGVPADSTPELAAQEAKLNG